MSTQIIGGRLAEIFGFKIMYGLGKIKTIKLRISSSSQKHV